ncbi:DUF6705 family protein [Lacinutrix sp. MEBiC02595]
MKNILIITLVLVSFFSCKAQKNIVPIFVEEGQQVDRTHINNYFKDIDNDFDAYIGRWKWENGTNSLEIIFNKKINRTDADGDSFDELVGEYKYRENGIVLVNSFPPLLLDVPNEVLNIINEDNSILSDDITTDNRGFPPCPACAPNTRFIILAIQEKTKPGVYGRIKMTRFVENGVEKIRMRINNTGNINNTNEKITIPENSIWTLTKIE